MTSLKGEIKKRLRFPRGAFVKAERSAPRTTVGGNQCASATPHRAGENEMVEIGIQFTWRQMFEMTYPCGELE